MSRLFTAAWGGFACVVALRAGQLGSAIEVVNRFGSYFYGSILGVFMLAVLTPRVRALAAICGSRSGWPRWWRWPCSRASTSSGTTSWAR